MVVLQRYKELFENDIQLSKPVEVLSTKSTTNTSTAAIVNTDLLSELLGDTLNTSSQDTNSAMIAKSSAKNTTLDELSEIFGSINNDSETNSKPHHPSDLLGNLDLLEPISVFESGTKDVSATTDSPTAIMNGKDEKKAQGFKELKEIDKLSEEMFKQSLKEEQRLLSFKK